MAVSKYADHLPLYRQEGIFRRHGVELSRSTMCDWMAAVAEPAGADRQGDDRRVLLSKVIRTDDTPGDGAGPRRQGIKTGRLWAYIGDRDNPFIVYDYTPDRSGDGPERFLKDYRRAISSPTPMPATTACTREGSIEVGCWVHARRKFHEARTSDPERSHAALAWIGRLYEVETRGAGAGAGTTPGATTCSRQERSRPLLESFGAWLEGEVDEGAAQEPDRRGDRLCRSNWTALIAVPRGGVPGDRQQRERERDAADRPGPEELAVLRQRPRRQDGGDLDEPGARRCKALGHRAVRLPPRRARPGEHAPEQPDRRNCCPTAGNRPESPDPAGRKG